MSEFADRDDVPSAAPRSAEGRLASPAADDELQFGEVQERLREPPPLSPHQDGLLAIAPVARPGLSSTGPSGSRWGRGGGNEATNTPPVIFLEIDAFLDMHQHAAEDTSIELGGLLLGRRGSDPDGKPWVRICDSLRARHYRATRGSFRFTHETWADLHRQRAELPESTEIVGWYHTHPGWGVFLSDQDIFICDHFFADPDDVALVIDPTSGDTGLFVRRGSPPDGPPQRLARYQLYAHRKRSAELNAWATFFSGVGTMSNPPAVFPSSSSPPIIVTTAADNSGGTKVWGALATGLLGAQVAILLVILASLSNRTAADVPLAGPDSTAIREAVIDDLLSKIASEGPEGASRSWRETALANEQLRAANLGLLSRVDSLSANLQTDRRRLEQAKRDLKTAGAQLAEAEDRLAALAAASPIDAETGGESRAEGEAEAGAGFDWKAVLGGATGGVIVGWLVAAFAARRPEWRRAPAARQEESDQ